MRTGLGFLALGFCGLVAPAVAWGAGAAHVGALLQRDFLVLTQSQRPNVRPDSGASSAPENDRDDALLRAEEVDQLLNGNTSEGFTLSSGNYREYYAADGTIHGKDFTGSWWMKDDAVCMSYPGITTYCYRVRKLRGGAIVWELDGEPSGYARILSGNHFDF